MKPTNFDLTIQDVGQTREFFEKAISYQPGSGVGHLRLQTRASPRSADGNC